MKFGFALLECLYSVLAFITTEAVFTTTSHFLKLTIPASRSKKLNVLFLGGILLASLYGFKKNQALEDLKVRSITIADDLGNNYAVISGNQTYGGWININDKNGRNTVLLAQMKQGGGYIGLLFC